MAEIKNGPETFQVGERFEIDFQPIVTRLLPEFAIRGAVEAAGAASLDWEIEKIEFPIVDGVKILRVTTVRVNLPRTEQVAATTILTLVAAMGAGLFAWFTVREIRRLAQEAPEVAAGLTLGVVAIIAIAVLFVARSFLR